MNFSDFKESRFMYILAAVVICFVLAQSVFFLVRAVKRGKELGISSDKMKNTAVRSALFSIAPAFSIVATIITLSAALGVVLPWIRLSVIGNLSYETTAAQNALDALGGGSISTSITDKTQFSTIAWVMTVCSVLPLVILPFALKKIQKGIGRAMGGKKLWSDCMSAAAFIGIVMAFVSRALLGTGSLKAETAGAGVLSLTGLVSSILFMFIFIFLLKKFPKLNKFESLAMPLSMFLAMATVIAANHFLPHAIAVLEWRARV